MVRLNISTYDPHINNGFGKERFERLFVNRTTAVAGRVLWIKVRPSVLPIVFLESTLGFSETLHGGRGPYGDVCGRQAFFEKKNYLTFCENGSNRFFWIYWKIGH